jgi:hypothetical protein
MGFADEVSAFQHRGASCTVGEYLGSLDKSDQDQIVAVMVDDKYTSTAITKALANRGFKVSSNTLMRHRRGDCKCLPMT